MMAVHGIKMVKDNAVNQFFIKPTTQQVYLPERFQKKLALAGGDAIPVEAINVPWLTANVSIAIDQLTAQQIEQVTVAIRMAFSNFDGGGGPPQGGPTGNTLTTNRDQLLHMFRGSPGHFPDDTPENRALIKQTAGNIRHYLGDDDFNNSWFAQELPNGTQVWAKVRNATNGMNGTITEGGLNLIPKPFHPSTGLNAPPRP